MDFVHVFWGKRNFLDRISISHLGIVCSHINDAFYTLKPVCVIDSCRKILKISAFFDTVFSKMYVNLRFSLKERAKRRVIFADPVSIFFLLDNIWQHFSITSTYFWLEIFGKLTDLRQFLYVIVVSWISRNSKEILLNYPWKMTGFSDNSATFCVKTCIRKIQRKFAKQCTFLVV